MKIRILCKVREKKFNSIYIPTFVAEKHNRVIHTFSPIEIIMTR